MQAEELTEETLAPLTKEEIVTKFLELQKTANESEQDAVLVKLIPLLYIVNISNSFQKKKN